MTEEDEGPIMRRLLPDGRELCLCPLTFGRVRITIGPPYEEGVYDDGY